ncbi:Tn3 family transposase [Streptomyces sp. NBC_00233]|uniref:Tn3 family transposase n=1 Tax=Streptomyces sp. NBC_00233 TaxID=2975686 RepID=UPI00225758FB|nr:Tn3 family transposase [Streptomyces sp. NBC_00233]MCX5233219.1 transposase [Streptomyces sp. NBC_00233]
MNHLHHVSEADSRAEHLVVPLAAVLVAEACNIGIHAMVSEDEPGRSRDQLFWVEQNHLRAETLRLANAVLPAEVPHRPPPIPRTHRKPPAHEGVATTN